MQWLIALASWSCTKAKLSVFHKVATRRRSNTFDCTPSTVVDAKPDPSTDASSAVSAVQSWKGQRTTEPTKHADVVHPRDPTAASATAANTRGTSSKPTAASGSSTTEDEEELMRAPAPRKREKVPASVAAAARSGLVAPAHGLSQITWSKAKAEAEQDTQRE